MNIIQHIQPGTTILTPNRRLSASLMKQFERNQKQQNITTWQTPDILPIQSWLQRHWENRIAQRIAKHPLLLSTQQEIVLWENILHDSPENDSLLQVSLAAETARNAWNVLKLWNLDYRNDTLAITEDGAVFQRWADAYHTLLEKNNWIDSASLPDFLIREIQENTINIPHQLILYGFTEISPQHQSLFETIKKSGGTITQYESNRTANSIQQIQLLDEETEILTMARWAKSIYLSNKNQCLIGCVVPQLAHLRESVLRIFREVFTESGTLTTDYIHLPFNISAGKNLDQWPLIHDALQLLSLHAKNLSDSFIHTLLFSPFLASAESERLQRANYAMLLRQANISSFSLQKLLTPNRKIHLKNICPALEKTIQTINENALPQQHIQSAKDWAQYFSNQLKQWGWPGERSLNSEEYQVAERGLTLLTEFATLDCVLPPMKQSEAFKYLKQFAQKTIFQTKTPETVVQISGVLEAAELPFTHLWVMGLDDNQWPFPPKPNPFIPLKIQKKYKMPHAHAERELEYCTKLFSQLQHSASNVIFSYAIRKNDEALRPSIFLKSLKTTTLENLNLPSETSAEQILLSHKKIETIVDETAPMIDVAEKIHGGTRIFRLQAACPFRAFAEIRLNASWPNTPTPGLRAIDRGNILHKALEYFWLTVQDSNTLVMLENEEYENLIKQSIEKSITFYTERYVSHERYLQLECQRLTRLLSQYLETEKKRPPFRVIACEKELNYTISNIPITLRIDRIDATLDNQYLIIDYKTSKYPSIQHWFGDRLDEPQLPLYCVTGNEKISGIAFAKLHPDTIHLTGVSDIDLSIPGIKVIQDVVRNGINWNEQLSVWQHTLENLADAFYAGVATVDPKEGQITCNTCQLKSLCRIHERI